MACCARRSTSARYLRTRDDAFIRRGRASHASPRADGVRFRHRDRSRRAHRGRSKGAASARRSGRLNTAPNRRLVQCHRSSANARRSLRLTTSTRRGTHVRFSPEHAVSDEERKAIAEEAFVELTRLLKEQFPRSANLEYAILKSHLIVEFAITDYIRCVSSVLVDLADLRRFSFAHKLEIAYLMGLG